MGDLKENVQLINDLKAFKEDYKRCNIDIENEKRNFALKMKCGLADEVKEVAINKKKNKNKGNFKKFLSYFISKL